MQIRNGISQVFFCFGCFISHTGNSCGAFPYGFRRHFFYEQPVFLFGYHIGISSIYKIDRNNCFVLDTGIMGAVLFAPSTVVVPLVVFRGSSIIPYISKSGIITLDAERGQDHVPFHKGDICAVYDISKGAVTIVFQPSVCHGKNNIRGWFQDIDLFRDFQ